MKEVEKKSKWLKKTATLGIVGVFVFVFFWLTAEQTSAINTQITFQGKLTNASGQTVSDGTYYLKFIIYDAATGGTCQYTATSSCSSVTSTALTVTNGLFSINLGDTAASLAALSNSLFNNSALYLGITVCSGPSTGCDSEMTPRKRLTASPYAFNADYLGGVTTSTAGGNFSYIPATDSSGNLKISGSFYSATTTAGQIGFGTSTVPAGIKTLIESTTASDKLLVIRGNSSQTGNLSEWQTSAGKPLAYLDTSGFFYTGDGSTSSTLQKNLLKVAYSSSDNLGKFYVDSSGNVSASGTLTTFGNTTLGGHLYPSTDNLYDIGSSSTQWRYGNFQGGLLIANGTTTSTLDNSKLIIAQGASDNLGKFYVDNSGNVSASGTLKLISGQSITWSDNTVNLGSTAAGAQAISIGQTASAGGDQAIAIGYSVTASANQSIGIGYDSDPTAQYSIAIGYDSDVAGTNSIGIGFNADVISNNALNIGNTIYGDLSTDFIGIGTASPADKLTVSSGHITATNNSSSSTLQEDALIVSQTLSTYNLGRFYVDSSGIVSASGSLYTFGNVTSTGILYASGGLISSASSTFSSNLNITGNTFASGTLQSTGSFLTYGNVTSTGILYSTNGLISSASSTFASNLQITGNARASSTLLVGTAAGINNFYVNGPTTQIGSTSASGTLQSYGNAQFTGNITPEHHNLYDLGSYTNAWNDVFASGTVYGNALTIAGNTTLGGHLYPSADNLYDIGSSSTQWRYGNFQGGILVTDGSTTSTLDNTRLIIAQGSTANLGKFYIDSSGNVSASGSVYAFGNVTSTGILYATNGLISSASSTFTSNLQITGNARASSTLLVGTAAGNNFFVNGTATTVSTTLNVVTSGSASTTVMQGDSLILGQGTNYNKGMFYVDSNGNTSASGTLTTFGNTTLGGHLYPSTDNLYDIGSSSTQWRYGNFQGGLLVADGSNTSTLTKNSLILIQGTSDNLGKFYIDSSGNVSASGSLYTYGNVTSTSHIYPASNNAVDLGAYSKAWRDVYVSSTLNVSGTSTFHDYTNVVGKVGNPTHKGSLANDAGGALLDAANSVFISGNYAYVASNVSDALEIIDISNPASPVHKGSITSSTINLLDDPFSVFVSGNYAYVVSYNNNALEIIDISNPASPVHKGSLTHNTGGASLNGPYSVFVSGNYAYVVSEIVDALEIIDISNPASPVHKGSLTNGTGGALLSNPYSVFVSGNYAYVASNASDALEIIDISNPASPVHKGSIASSTTNLLDGPFSVFVSGNYAYVASNVSDALEIVDVSNPANPVHKGSIASSTINLLDGAFSVFVSGNYAYVASYNDSALEIIDISSSTLPVHKGSLSNNVGGALLSGPISVFVSGNYAYVASHDSDALEIIDISGAQISNAQIGSLTAGTFQVSNLAQFNQGLLVHDGLNVGGNTQLFGDVSIGGGRATTTNMGGGGLSIITNQTSSTLISRVFDVTGATGFIFNTGTSTWTSNSDRNLVSFQTGGTDKFLFGADGSMVVNKASGYNLGKFYVDSSGNVSASGSLYTYGNVTSTGIIYASGGLISSASSTFSNDLYIAGNLDIGAEGSGLSQLYIKATSTKAVPLSIYNESGRLIAQIASSTDVTIITATGAQETSYSNSALRLGNSTDSGVLSIVEGIISVIGSNGDLRISLASPEDNILYSGLVMGTGGSTSTLTHQTLTLAIGTGANLGKFFVNSSGNVSASGTLRVFGNSSAVTGGLLISADNTSTTLKSYASGAGAGAFILDTNSALSIASSSILLSVRNAGAKVFSVGADGYVTATGTIQANNTSPGPGDVAEYVNLVPGESVEAGDVVVADLSGINKYKKSTEAYAKNVAGVISDTGAFVIGASGENRAALALAGLVKVKVTDENGPIQVGDYLVTASQPGYAMKYNPDQGKPAGLVGMALEPLTSGQGKILLMINKGYVDGASSQNIANLNVSQNADGQLVQNSDLNMAGQNILNVKSISGSNDKWMIDEEGYLVIKVTTKQGEKKLYSLQSGQGKEMILSGSSQLENGLKKIEFDLIDQEIIDHEAPIKVSVTLTSEANGVFVKEKSYQGFTVKELNNGTSQASFDWIVVVKKKDFTNAPTDVGATNDTNVEPSSAKATAGAPAETPPSEPSPVVEPPAPPAETAPAETFPVVESPASETPPAEPPPTPEAPPAE